MIQPTSIAAYKAAQDFVIPVRERILEYLKSCGASGATDQEMQTRLGLGPQTQTSVRNQLFNQGWVDETNERRETRSGRKAIVWVASSGKSSG